MLEKRELIPAYCPNCDAYGSECQVDMEDWDKPCPYYKPYEPEVYNPEPELE